MDVRTMLSHYSYVGKVLIISSETKKKYDEEIYANADDLKDDALFFGENYKTRSELYRDILDMEIRNYYCDICEYDAVLVIVTKN